MKKIAALLLLITSCLVFSQSTRYGNQNNKRQQSQNTSEKLSRKKSTETNSNRYNSRDAKGVINRGKTFQKDTKLYSANGNYYLIFQNDGNLVFYNRNKKVIWSSNTQNRGRKAVFQEDGNLVVYNRANKAIYATETNNNQNNKLVVQDDGNLVIYNCDNVEWASK